MNLVIRTAKSEGNAPLYTKVRCQGKTHWINLYIKVDIQEWNKHTNTARQKENYLDRKQISKKLNDIEFGIKELKRKHTLTKETVDSLVQDIVFEEYRQRIIKQEELKQQMLIAQRLSVKHYVSNYLKDIKSGEIRTKKNSSFAKGTIKAISQFCRIFLDFYETTPFSWNEINQHLVNRFLSFLECQQYAKKSQAKYMKSLKALFARAEMDGASTNSNAKYLCYSVVVKESEKCKEIYLSKEELQAFFDMDLEGTEEKVRDLFLIGCYTGQRIGDYARIDSSWIGRTAKNTKVIRLYQEKTGHQAVIPIVDNNLETLLKKYDYNVPEVSEQELNRTIKELGKRLSKKLPSLAIKERTILKLQEKKAEQKSRENGIELFEYDKKGFAVKPRWQLISSHTARRSCITNMYLSGKFTKDEMMGVSGHKTEKQFMEYVKLSLDEKADLVAMSSIDGLF